MSDISKPTRHHTVPKAYLKGFVLPSSADHKFDVFDKQDNRWKRGSPKSTTVVRDHYTVVQVNSGPDTSLETWLNARVESPGIGPLRKLSHGMALSAPERIAFANYVGLLLTRTVRLKKLQDLVNTRLADRPEFAIAWVEACRENVSARFPSNEVDEFIEQLQTGKKALRLPNHWYLALLERGLHYARFICDMNWHIETAGNDDWFITSDNPAFFCRPTRPDLIGLVGITRDDLRAELCFPLTPKSYFRASYTDLSRNSKRASSSRVNELNRRVAVRALDLVIAPTLTGNVKRIVEENAAPYIPEFPEGL